MNSRKLLSSLETTTQLISPPISSPNTTTTEPTTTFDANVIMILSVLLCAVLCGLGINSIVRCAFRCSTSDVEQVSQVQPTRVRRKAVRALPVLVFSDLVELPGGNAECAICLSELVAGERVRVLPKCNHGFHVKCIDRWLMGSSSCPTCRQCLFPFKTKVAGCAVEDAPTGSTVTPPPPPPPPLPPAVELVLPLEAEGFVSSFR
ncbi:E3 ubiquitin-protein ligase ATL10/75/76/77/78 protein [Dioscorea alata]|uniref:E3 ubiquitin-protein ligase ATL10/75/76/77/78 protein n=1 Tax=Dioscorea alata TaxID=55571 RepID=A0ACB7VZH7_DIOAL|nr:E3 ubiquitin-protein ligase ATL10/75/76/77/78 protein [Dioscorea alata]